MRLTFDDIVKLEYVRLLHPEATRPRPLSGVSTDSRTTRKNDVFFALRGERYDGHNFLTKAAGLGASAAVVEERWAATNEPLLASLRIPIVVVRDSVEALGRLASTVRRQFRIPVIAIVGSNGKTTTKEMVSSVLKRKYSVLATEGNLNNQIGVPLTLFRLQKSHEVAVLELGTNHFGEIAALCDIAQPTHGLITNIGSEHLEFFGDLSGVARAEGELAVWLKAHRPDVARVIINHDDPVVRTLLRGFPHAISYGITSRTADLRASLAADYETMSTRLELRASGSRPVEVWLPLPGRHNAMNALAAAATARMFKVPWKEIKAALEHFQPASKRTEIVRVGGVTILNDSYNANPDSVRAALETLDSMSSTGKKVAVLGDMFELGRHSDAAHEAIGNALSQSSLNALLTCGEQARRIHDGATLEFKAHYEQKNMLAEYLVEFLSPGDVVLVKGSRGMKMEDIVTFVVERLSRSFPKTGS